MVGRKPCLAVAIAAAFAGGAFGGAAPARAIVLGAPVTSTTAGVAHEPDVGEQNALESARRDLSSDDTSGAIAKLAAYASAHPKATTIGTLLGDLYIRMGDIESAERAYGNVLRANSALVEVHDKLGTVYEALDRNDDAIVEFQAAIPLARAYDHLVEAHRLKGDLGSFEMSFRDAVRLAPFDADALWGLGLVLLGENRPAEAVASLDRASAIGKASCPNLLVLGDGYRAIGDLANASETVTRCLSASPADYSALVALASLDLDRGGRESQAYGLLRRAQAEDPDRAEAYIDFGFIEDDAGRWENAIDLYRKSLTLDPLEREAYIDLGYDYLSHGLYAQAERTLSEGLVFARDDGRLHYFLGMTYLREGKHDSARVEFREAMHGTEPEVARAAAANLAKT